MNNSIKRLLPLYKLGWAFFLAWVFCVFYTQVMEGYTGAKLISSHYGGLSIQSFFLGSPVFFSILALSLIIALEKRFGSPIQNKNLLFFAPLLTSLASPLLFIQIESPVGTILLFGLGALFTGMGSALIWVMWGEYYAKISQEDVEILAPASAVVASVILLFVSSMSGWVALLLVSSLPFISGMCLKMSLRDGEESDTFPEFSGTAERKIFETRRSTALQNPLAAFKALRRAGFGILLTFFFACILGAFWFSAHNEPGYFQITVVVSIVFMGLVSVYSSREPGRMSVVSFFRWMCPLLILGFVAIILFDGGEGFYLAYAVSLTARFSFCVITQIFFAHYAASGRTTAVQAYGFGWLFVHIGDLLGIVCMILLEPLFLAGVLEPYQVSALSIAVLAIATMAILNQKGTFVIKDTIEVSEGGGDSASSEEKSPEAFVVDELEENINAIAEKAQLTPREKEVFDLLSRGRSVPFIRDELIISRNTVATHVKHIYAKLEVHSRQELIDLVHEYRL